MYQIFLYAILLAPLPFGANRPWAWSLYASLLALFCLLACVATLSGKSSVGFSLKPARYLLFLSIIPFAWGILQLSTITPADWAHPFWQLASAQLPGDLSSRISLAPSETGTALMKLGSYLLVFVISLHFNKQIEYAELTFKGLAYAGMLYAVYGLIIYLGGYNTLLWFDKWTVENGLSSTFVNRNSYATYAGLTLLISFQLLFDKIQSGFKFGIKTKFGKQYFLEFLLTKGWFTILSITTIITVLILTQSRGGLASTLIAMTTLFLILALSGKIKTSLSSILMLAAAGLVFIGIFSISGDKITERFGHFTPDSTERLRVYEIINNAISENLWLGVGYGSFDKSFRLYRDDTITVYYDKAHNTYLENIFELGFFQASTLFLAILIAAMICLRGVWVRHRNWIYPAIGFAASLLVGIHALVDFSLQIPAVAYTYALIMGTAIAQATSTRKNCHANTKHLS